MKNFKDVGPNFKLIDSRLKKITLSDAEDGFSMPELLDSLGIKEPTSLELRYVNYKIQDMGWVVRRERRFFRSDKIDYFELG
ncbi:hypothetical protein [Methylobacter sp. S3L5C]|uniref:hypothetical protein n=1 Tax=Methylobacter sp. S3L5C TaxID=2839024 RepID=UPI001FABCD08|nr:hypothetical protein [Methylobacter sp. S3L5C]UOA08342.1 hypothetical protein KKZ03_19400 [Methylobacter sp. S3L5C]